MTQEAIADRMGTTKSAVSRLEGAGKHAPSVASLKKYADAVGCTLKIEFIPQPVKRRAANQPSAVNTVLSNLKTAISGTYHAFDFRKYADRYLAEVQYRFNRRFDLGTIVNRLVRAAITTFPCPETTIRAAEAGN